MPELKNLESLPEEVRETFRPFLNKMFSLHQDNIQSVYIYGSATGSNFIPEVSDINSIFIFHQLNFNVFKKSLRIISEGVKRRISAPLFMTHSEIESSLDIFPIEFLEMQENHILIFGEDMLSNLQIEGKHIRLFCEQQIKGKLIRIHQAYLQMGAQPERIKFLFKDSLNSLIPIFRNLIRLKGLTPSLQKLEILNQICQQFHLDHEVFLSTYRVATQQKKLTNKESETLLEKYFEEMRKLSAAVDRL